MAGRPAKHKVVLLLRTEQVATPARVAETARLFADAIKAAGDVPVDRVTMVVNNLSMTSELRAHGQKAIQSMKPVVEAILDPTKAAAARPAETHRIAEALAKTLPTLVGTTIAAPGRRKRRVAIDDTLLSAFKEAMVTWEQGVASSPAPESLRGETEIATPVLRIGRTNEGAQMMVRLVLDGKPQDIEVSGDSTGFFNAARDRTRVVVRLDAAWVQEKGRVVFDVARTKALRVLHEEPVLSGAEFVEAMDKIRPEFEDAEWPWDDKDDRA